MNSPAQIAKIYSEVGAGKTKIPFGKLLVLSILAGAFIALGAFGSSIVGCNVQPAAFGRFMSGAAFSVGLAMVILGGAELFTGNSLILLSVAQKKATVLGMLKNWVVVYLGNFIGGVTIAAMVVYGHSVGMFNGELVKATVATAVTKVNLTFMECLIRGILCNIMVSIAVWMAIAADDAAGKVAAMFLPIFVFVISGYEHCVANFYFIPAGIFAASEYAVEAAGLNWLTFLKNELPVTIGNIIGGGVCVGLSYWYIYLKGTKEE